jgi:type IV pilus assembly protein PilO
LASWYLLIAPKRSDASALRTQKVEQDAANQRLVQQLEVLKAQAQDLPKQEAFLAQIRRQLPNNPALPALIRDLTSAAKKSGVALTSLAPSLPVAVVSQGVVAPTTAPGSTTGTASAPTAPAPVLYQVPIIVKVDGSYFEMEQFLNKVEGLKRSFLVSGFTLRKAEKSAATEVSTTGDLQLEIQGRVFLSPEAAAAITAPASAGSAPSTASPAN